MKKRGKGHWCLEMGGKSSMGPQFDSERNKSISKGAALKFVVLLGVVSLFADMTYEGARSVTGPYLAILGASGTVVGVVAGFGEWSATPCALCRGMSLTGQESIGR